MGDWAKARPINLVICAIGMGDGEPKSVDMHDKECLRSIFILSLETRTAFDSFWLQLSIDLL